MEFQDFCTRAENIENLSSNKSKINEIEDLLAECDEDSIPVVVRFIQGRKFPLCKNENLGYSTSLMKQAISKVTDISEGEIESRLTEVDDMGGVFEIFDMSVSQRTLSKSSLTVSEVYKQFVKISEESGSGSQKRKTNYMVDLLSRCNQNEAKYLTKLTLGELNIGVGQKFVEDALCNIYGIEKDIVERSMMLTNDSGKVAMIANRDGLSGLKSIGMNVGESPMRPMKATAGNKESVFDDMNVDKVYADYKYDGFRIQAHISDGDVTLYTNRLENVTNSLPDIVKTLEEHVRKDNVVLDGEVVGYRTTDFKTPLPYQETQQRIRRKYNIDEMVESIPVTIEVFDVLYDSELLIDNTMHERNERLEKVCDTEITAKRKLCSTQDDIDTFLESSQIDGHEGLMVKSPESKYEPHSRGKRWMKLKPEGETVDVNIIGGEYGDGRRSDYISSLQIGVQEGNTGSMLDVGRVGTGFKDEDYEDLTESLEQDIVSQDGKFVQIDTDIVIEVKFEEVQESPKYESGYSLRFPKFIRRRPTKPLSEVDTVERLKKIGQKMSPSES